MAGEQLQRMEFGRTLQTEIGFSKIHKGWEMEGRRPSLPGTLPKTGTSAPGPSKRRGLLHWKDGPELHCNGAKLIS